MRMVALGCFLACTVLATAQAAADDAPLAALQGTWKVVGNSLNGKPVKDRQADNSQLTFCGDELLMEPGDGSQRERHKLKPEAGSNPPAFSSERIEPADRPQSGWTIYEVKGDRLRIGFFDALKGRPKSFDPQPKLIVLELKKVAYDPRP